MTRNRKRQISRSWWQVGMPWSLMPTILSALKGYTSRQSSITKFSSKSLVSSSKSVRMSSTNQSAINSTNKAKALIRIKTPSWTCPSMIWPSSSQKDIGIPFKESWQRTKTTHLNLSTTLIHRLEGKRWSLRRAIHYLKIRKCIRPKRQVREHIVWLTFSWGISPFS